MNPLWHSDWQVNAYGRSGSKHCSCVVISLLYHSLLGRLTSYYRHTVLITEQEGKLRDISRRWPGSSAKEVAWR